MKKTCNRCFIEKELNYFHKSNNTKDGHHTICVACRRRYVANSLTNMRARIVHRLGARCASNSCKWINSDGSRGCLDPRTLQIDHRFGGGLKEIREKGTAAFYLELSKLTDEELFAKYQCLCANCNWIKRYVRRENPNKRLDNSNAL